MVRIILVTSTALDFQSQEIHNMAVLEQVAP